MEGTPLDANTSLFDVFANIRSDDMNIGPRRQQLIQLGRGHGTAAHEEHRTAGEIQEERQ
jgi:hypothetical protein